MKNKLSMSVEGGLTYVSYTSMNKYKEFSLIPFIHLQKTVEFREEKILS